MIFDDNSDSDSESNADFTGLMKKVEFKGNLVDSDESSSHRVLEKGKRRNYSKRISSLVNKEEGEMDKTKLIKKNCISAKKSRQRKKLYIEELQKKAEELKEKIESKKQKIHSNRHAIFNMLREHCPEKSRFIEEHIKDSKMLANMLTSSEADSLSSQQKKQQIQYMINSFLYKFGLNGVLKKDVMEQLKFKWYELAINEGIIASGNENQLRELLQKFQHCIGKIESKSSDLDYLLQKLQTSMSQHEIIRFLLNEQFLPTPQDKSKATIFKLDLCQIPESS